MPRTTKDPVRAAVDRDPGSLAHAVRLLDWWATDDTDDPRVIEVCKQSREVARSLKRIDRAARRRKKSR